MDSALLGILLALATALPLAWKWGLGLPRVALVVLALGLFSGVLVKELPGSGGYRTGLVWVLAMAAAFVILAYRFYRDPERQAPERDDVIVSPADGEVIYVRESRGATLPVSTKDGRHYTLRELTRTLLQTDDAHVIGISMSFLDVHVNRAPIAGRVAVQRHFCGKFGSLRRPEMVFENERATTIIERDGLQVAVVQIASRLVRQIVTFVREGQSVTLGERIGMIRLGSQVDLVLPARPDVKVLVKPGESVWAGQSILAVLAPADLGSAGAGREGFCRDSNP